MITIFSKLSEIDLRPNKKNIWVIIVVFIFSVILYLLAATLYLICINKNCNIKLEFYKNSIVILEILITFFSFLISSFSTYIANRFNNKLIETFDEFHDKNEINIMENDILDQINKSKKINKFKRILIIITMIISLFYVIAALIWHCYNKAVLEIFVFVFSFLSTLVSLLLSLVSTISYYVIGKNLNLLINSIHKKLIDANNNNNSQLIDKSYYE